MMATRPKTYLRVPGATRFKEPAVLVTMRSPPQPYCLPGLECTTLGVNTNLVSANVIGAFCP